MVNARTVHGTRIAAIVHGQVPSILLAMSVALNLWLSARLTPSFGATVRPALVGASVPPLSGRSIHQAPLRIDYQRPTVVYFFSPRCTWCERNWSNVNSLVTAIEGKYQFIGVSAVDNIADDPGAPWQQFEVFAPLDRHVLRAYRFGGTPQTVVVLPGGRVVQSWFGAYRLDVKTKIERFFQIKLPGLDQI